MGKRSPVPRSSSLRGSIITTRGVSNFASFARETERGGCKGACGYYRANYDAGSIHLHTKSMTNRSLTANGNEPASRVNLKRVGWTNYAGDDAHFAR